MSGHAASCRHVVKPWRATRAPLGVEAVDLGDKGNPLADAREGTLNGFRLARWADRERGYVVVSDIDADELAAFVAAFRGAEALGGGEAR